jgi:ribosomal protein S18 acetylase RimI-like enzyme
MPPPLRAAAGLGIAYRPMAEEDLPFVAALFASTRADEVAQTGWPPEMQRAFLAQQHHAQHVHYQAHYPAAEWLIIEQEGEPVGRLYLDQSAGRHHVIDISLLPELRGRGVGGAIMADVLDAARAAGQSVSIHVERHNPARRLYDRLGFTQLEDQGVYLLLEWRAPDDARDQA